VEYRCAKFGDFSFRSFGFIVRTNTHTHTKITYSTDAAKRFTPATVVGVTHADDSRWSKAFSGVCTVCDLCVCLFVRTIKPKLLKLKSPNLAQRYSITSPPPINNRSKGQRSRSQIIKCKKVIECPV